MFLDEVKINIKAGDGGNGAVSFFFLKNSYKKIACGGFGGIGGNVLFRASRSVNTLAAFKKRYISKLKMDNLGYLIISLAEMVQIYLLMCPWELF